MMIVLYHGRLLTLLLALLMASAASATQTEATPSPPRAFCAAPEFHLMDYMIGDWDVVETATGAHFLYNRVEPINGGCALRENLLMQNDAPGSSMTFFSRKEGRWHQFYHSPGLYAHLEGTTTPDGVNELLTRAEFPGLPGLQYIRQVTRRDASGRPRQIGYARATPDEEWRVIWDLTFCSRTQGAALTPPCGPRR